MEHEGYRIVARLDEGDVRLVSRNRKGQDEHLVPGRELKARYAFDDIWEADRETE